MPKGVPNKRYTPEFKKLVIETMQEEKLSYSETCRRFEVNSRDRIKSWERIHAIRDKVRFSSISFLKIVLHSFAQNNDLVRIFRSIFFALVDKLRTKS